MKVDGRWFSFYKQVIFKVPAVNFPGCICLMVDLDLQGICEWAQGVFILPVAARSSTQAGEPALWHPTPVAPPFIELFNEEGHTKLP